MKKARPSEVAHTYYLSLYYCECCGRNVADRGKLKEIRQHSKACGSLRFSKPATCF